MLGACKKSDDGNEETLLTLLLAQSTVSVPCANRCHVFLTATKVTGSIGTGGITGADAVCNADSNKVQGKTYKALLTVPGVREVLGAIIGTLTYTDWVLKASTFYSSVTDVSNPTGATTIVKRVFNGSNILMQMNFTIGSNGTRFWTGMTNNAGSLENGVNCTNWTSANGGVNGLTGVINASSTSLVDTTTNTCNTSLSLVCIEQ